MNHCFRYNTYRSSLIYSIASVLEDKTSIAPGQTPHQTELADMRQPSSVMASDDVKDEASKRSRINDEVDSDDTPDLKREYAKALTVFLFSLLVNL